VNTLAQTLHKIRATKSKKEAARLIAKLRVYTISDQDDSGVWIRKNFPDLFYIVSPGDHYNGSTWNGIMSRIEGIDNRTLSNTWLAKNIQQGHGPLGAEYPDVAWGMEGDTPAFLSLIHNGLNDTDHPEWGAWGGRYELYTPDFAQQKQGHSGVPFEAETRPIWTNANDKYSPYVANEYGRNVRKESLTFEDNKASLWRWRDDFQNDFAARMDWCLASYKDANHAPVPMLQHSDQITLKSGEKFTLDASNSTDPDGDNLSFLWFQYPEEGSYKELIPNGAAENIHTYYIQAPEVEKAETVHYILKVTDKGSPAISRYRRIIVTVLPK
ncbi:MAG: nucleoside hydrolase-like domain-containing protein, partial [Bacteroidota bacterium]